jgi:hypothetical protein
VYPIGDVTVLEADAKAPPPPGRLKKVGWIFTQSVKERDFIMSAEEVRQMCELQHEVGDTCVTAVVGLAATDEGTDVHFEVGGPFDGAGENY